MCNSCTVIILLTFIFVITYNSSSFDNIVISTTIRNRISGSRRRANIGITYYVIRVCFIIFYISSRLFQWLLYIISCFVFCNHVIITIVSFVIINVVGISILGQLCIKFSYLYTYLTYWNGLSYLLLYFIPLIYTLYSFI